MKTIEDLLIPTANPTVTVNNQIRSVQQEPPIKSLTKESPQRSPSGSNHQNLKILKQESVSSQTKAKKRILKGQEKVKAVVQRAME